MTGAEKRLVCIACSIFKDELESLQASDQAKLPVRFLGSMLHMVPERLEEHLKAAVAEEVGKGNEVLLAYGDCCPHMLEMEAAPGLARTVGINCCEIILGSETYRRMRREGVFFLMPEWTLAWRKVFTSELGLFGENASAFMREMHTRLVYLDTGLIAVPLKELEELKAYTGLPCEIMRVSLDPLLAKLREAMARIAPP